MRGDKPGGKDREHEEGMGTSGEVRRNEPEVERQYAPYHDPGVHDPWVESPDNFSLRVRAWTWLGRRRRRRN
jgi:hypothetical protein